LVVGYEAAKHLSGGSAVGGRLVGGRGGRRMRR